MVRWQAEERKHIRLLVCGRAYDRTTLTLYRVKTWHSAETWRHFVPNERSPLTAWEDTVPKWCTVCRVGRTTTSDVADMPPSACIHQGAPRNCENNEFVTYFQHLMPSVSGTPLSCRVRIWYGETRMAGLQSGESRIMIDSVVWAQYINVTDTQPRRHKNRT